MVNQQRIIAHIDLNSFFATSEQQDDPWLRGVPLGVVQDSGKRSVIIGSSREAKMLGIGTGMPIWEARKIYPGIKTVPANFNRYVTYSRLFRRVCQHYTDQVEVFSVDELFMDVTAYRGGGRWGAAVAVAKEIKRRLKVEVGSWFTVSVGIAPNKMLAKLASGSRKPDGLVVVKPEARLEFLDEFEMWHICGIAGRIERRLNKLGIYTIAQMRQASMRVLTEEFGIMGKVYYQWAWGKDFSPVLKNEQVASEKSFGSQVTLPEDLSREKDVLRVFLNLSWEVAARMREKGMGAKTVSLWLREGSRWGRKQYSPGRASATADDIYRTVRTIYKQLKWSGPVRFVGISAGNLTPLEFIPLSLLNGDSKKERLAAAGDKLAKKYGRFWLRPAALLGGRIKQSSLNGFSKRF